MEVSICYTRRRLVASAVRVQPGMFRIVVVPVATREDSAGAEIPAGEDVMAAGGRFAVGEV